MPMIRIAEATDLEQIVDVHIAAFPNFFLTLLGHRFLKAMYRAFLLTSGSAFVVSETDGNIDGFAVGLLASSDPDWYAALRFFPSFALALIIALITNPIVIIHRIVAKFISDKERVSIPSNAMILRSIGVRPENQGRGTAKNLIVIFEKIAKTRNATSVALTTDADNNDRAIRFYSKLGYEPVQKFRQSKSRSMLLLIKNLTL